MIARARVALDWSVRLAVAGVFLVAAIPKILDPAQFASDISNYQAFPYWSWNVLAGTVPMLELVGAASLLTGWRRGAGATLLGILTVAFTLLIASVMVRGIDVTCGCFGTDPDADGAGWPELIRDVALLAGIWLSLRLDPATAAATATDPG